MDTLFVGLEPAVWAHIVADTAVSPEAEAVALADADAETADENLQPAGLARVD